MIMTRSVNIDSLRAGPYRGFSLGCDIHFISGNPPPLNTPLITRTYPHVAPPVHGAQMQFALAREHAQTLKSFSFKKSI